MINIFEPGIDDLEFEAVKQVLNSKWIGKGNKCTQFEKEFAEYLDTEPEKILLTNNCTSAIHITLRSLGIGDGDEVIVPDIHFVAAASEVVKLGGMPVLADVDPKTFNILPSEIERLRTEGTKAVLLLHYGGRPCDMIDIHNVCDGLFVIEDAANATASTYRGAACGTLGDAGVWSFDAMKPLTMGDGGALWLYDKNALDVASSLRYLGLQQNTSSGKSSMENGNKAWWEYKVDYSSGRYISNDIAASIGRIQLQKLSGFIARRKAIWDRYQIELADTELVLPPEIEEGNTSTYYLYPVQTPRRDELAKYLAENDVYTTFRYWPLSKAFGAEAECPNADYISKVTLNLPLHQNLSDGDVTKIVGLVKQFFGE
jgi:aminotransferase